jgi:MoaA/NifB/PqqE/SkfB family radical SAM enzyme
LDGLHAPADRALEALGLAYAENWPTQGELIFTGACDFTCQHCIYPPSFARHNRGLSVETWQRVLDDIYHNLGARTFVYGGRSLTTEGLDVLAGLRRRHPDAHIGLIDNGISMVPVRERIGEVKADWIDVSLDGNEHDHDVQRGRTGSYLAGLEGAHWLVNNGIAPRVNILTCLTTLNRGSVIPMIRELNAEGFKNFFITPVTVVDGVRPTSDLVVSAESFAAFVGELREVLPLLDDAWVELTLYAAVYAEYVAKHCPELWAQLVMDRDGLSWGESSGKADTANNTSELYLRYYPSSLTGTRELIVNTNGDVIVPKAMAAGRVADKHVLGNLLQEEVSQLVRVLPESVKFEFYRQEFLQEQSLLRRYV